MHVAGATWWLEALIEARGSVDDTRQTHTSGTAAVTTIAVPLTNSALKGVEVTGERFGPGLASSCSFLRGEFRHFLLQ
jgi:hypothetical protein